MGRTLPASASQRHSKKKKGRRKEANTATSFSSEVVRSLLLQATEQLSQGLAEEALSLGTKALQLVNAPQAPLDLTLSTLELLGEVNIELGDGEQAQALFAKAAELDTTSVGAPDKYLWLAQLSPNGGAESIAWFEKGIGALRALIRHTDGEETRIQRAKLSNALCGAAEVYMTDLSWEDDAEARCEAYVTEACMVSPDAPEPLQTLASVRISQGRVEDARSALDRSLEMWFSDTNPSDEHEISSVEPPDFPTRISLARLLMEVEWTSKALKVLEQLIVEDDTSVEAWYLGGWCLHLAAETDSLEREVLLRRCKRWLDQCLKLYARQEYEDDRLKEHAEELSAELTDYAGSEHGTDTGDYNEDNEDDEDSD